MAIIKEDSVYTACGVTVKVKKIPFGTRWERDCAAEGFKRGDLYKADRLLSSGTGKICGITVHNTGDSADAATYTLATFNQNMNSARVHFYVDSREAWQLLELCEVGWHAGTGNYGRGNDDTVAVEIIMGGTDGESNLAARENGAALVAYLLKITGLSVDDVHTHKEWSGKHCPAYLLPDWQGFLRLVAEKLALLTSACDGTGDVSNNNDEQMCGNAAEKSTQSGGAETADEYARSAVERAVASGVLVGDTTGSLRLREPLTRQDLCVVLERLGLV